MDPQSIAHVVRLLRTIAVELRISNDLAQNEGYSYSTAFTETSLAERREAYREEMS